MHEYVSVGHDSPDLLPVRLAVFSHMTALLLPIADHVASNRSEGQDLVSVCENVYSDIRS